VPARATLTTWLLVGQAADDPPPSDSAADKPSPNRRKIQKLLYDRTDGQDRLILPGTTPERIRQEPIPYRKREPSTEIIIDERPVEGLALGRLPQPETRADEALQLARVFRATRNLSEIVRDVDRGPLPTTPDAMYGIDHIILASDRIANDLEGLQAL